MDGLANQVNDRFCKPVDGIMEGVSSFLPKQEDLENLFDCSAPKKL